MSLTKDWLSIKLQLTDAECLSAYTDITNQLTEFVQQSSCDGYVIGLSGGIDSALAAALAVQAVGASRVLSVLMPGPFSTPASISDASTLAANLEIDTLILPITNVYETLKQQYSDITADLHTDDDSGNNEEPAFDDVKHNLALQNLQARLRAVHLMTLANSRNLLVLNTGNKSEAAMGYSTLYGDTIGAIAPIGDLYKTQVYALVNYYNTAVAPQRSIPTAIIDKPPSAELYEGQLDTDSLLPYSLLDQWLYACIEQDVSAEDAAAQINITSEQSHELLNRVKQSSFKRAAEPAVIILNSVQFIDFDARLS